jgi:hypothetical protein
MNIPLLGDAYERRARLAPAALVALPLIVFFSYAFLHPLQGLLIPILTGAGVTVIAAEITRSRGKATERALVPTWDGLPTTRALRRRGAGDGKDRRRHRRLVDALLPGQLPTAADEAADPIAADARYDAAVRAVLAKLRADNHAAVLNTENRNYGFRRNMLGLRAPALIVLLLAALADLALLLVATPLLPLAGLGVHLIAACVWLRVVRPGWVEEQANTFSAQLYVELAALVATATPAVRKGAAKR